MTPGFASMEWATSCWTITTSNSGLGCDSSNRRTMGLAA